MANWQALLLENALAGTLATINGDGSPYAVPVHFVYMEGKIYAHSGYHGQKLENIRRDPRVSFCAFDLEGITGQGNPSPCKTGASYESAVLNGAARVIEDKEEKLIVLRKFAEKYSPEKDPLAVDPLRAEATCVIEIEGRLAFKKKPTS